MSQITALEYFGYNCQTYMKHKEFLFRDASEVGVYLQGPIYKGAIDDATAIWATTLNKFDPSIDFDNFNLILVDK